MICLDTNYLIRGIIPGTSETAEVAAWAEDEEAMVTPLPAWFEFLCGPVTEIQVSTIRAFLTETLPFAEREAALAAHLFNKTGRKRQHRMDAMIAGTAIASRAQLATNNRDHFEPFILHGLQLL